MQDLKLSNALELTQLSATTLFAKKSFLMSFCETYFSATISNQIRRHVLMFQTSHFRSRVSGLSVDLYQTQMFHAISVTYVPFYRLFSQRLQSSKYLAKSR